MNGKKQPESRLTTHVGVRRFGRGPRAQRACKVYLGYPGDLTGSRKSMGGGRFVNGVKQMAGEKSD